MSEHEVRVGPLPTWMHRGRLLGDADWSWDEETRHASATLSRPAAADLMARLRGLGFDGEATHVQVRPRLKRNAIREGRTRVARSMRQTTPGFTRPGVRLDEVGRFSLTPEKLAMQLAKRMKGRTVLDVCCGCGGNAIAFARTGCTVTAVELDATRLDMARHNARIYGVSDRIRFILGDGVAHAAKSSDQVLFIDPPWNDWDHIRSTVADMPLLEQVLPFRDRFEAFHAKLPPSFDTRDLAMNASAVFGKAAGDRHRVKFIHLWG